MPITLLDTPYKRAWGALGRRSLGEDVLVFLYPHCAPRLFHTFFCPPLRLIALDAEGEVIYDRVLRRWQFVRLPSTCLVIALDAAAAGDARAWAGVVRALVPPGGAGGMGGLAQGVAADRLVFALIAGALADLRALRQTGGVCCAADLNVAALRQRFPAWRRGQLLASAGFLLEVAPHCRWALPQGALRLSRQLVVAEAHVADELLAASEAGGPWQGEFARACLRCGTPHCSWRRALPAPQTLPPEAAWRLERPENSVPLCRDCARQLAWSGTLEVRLDLAWGLWGPRFEALLRWYRAAQQDALPPAWSRLDYPLWPRDYGGATWAQGSGALADCHPREPLGIVRGRAQREALARQLGLTLPKARFDPEKFARQTGTGLTFNQILFAALAWVGSGGVAGLVLGPVPAVLFAAAGGLMYLGTLEERRQAFRLRLAQDILRALGVVETLLAQGRPLQEALEGAARATGAAGRGALGDLVARLRATPVDEAAAAVRAWTQVWDNPAADSLAAALLAALEGRVEVGPLVGQLRGTLGAVLEVLGRARAAARGVEWQARFLALFPPGVMVAIALTTPQMGRLYAAHPLWLAPVLVGSGLSYALSLHLIRRGLSLEASLGLELGEEGLIRLDRLGRVL